METTTTTTNEHEGQEVLPLWSENPTAWIKENQGNEGFVQRVLDVLRPFANANLHSVATLRPVAYLLRAISSEMSFLERQDPQWMHLGPVCVPSSPEGVAVLRALRQVALNNVQTFSLVTPNSPLGLLLDAYRTVQEAYPSLYRGVKNETLWDGKPENQGFRIDFGLYPLAIRGLPSGKFIPPSILQSSLIGKEMTGDQVLEIANREGWCANGVSEFLSSHGISHARNGGDCVYCGSSNEDGDSEVSWCEDFTLTEGMIGELECLGYLDEVLQFFGEKDSAESWEALFEGVNDLEVLQGLVQQIPEDPEDGISFDNETWIFELDVSEIEGLSDLEFEMQARVLPVLGQLALSYTDRGFMPPLPGFLHRKSNSALPSWRWDPEEGRIRHAVGTPVDAVLEIDVRNGGPYFRLPNGKGGTPIERNGNSYLLRCAMSHGGSDTLVFGEIAQSRVVI